MPVVLTPEQTVRFAALLQEANGRRTARTLSLDAIRKAIEAALESGQPEVRHGGTVDDARGHTTLVLAMREGAFVTVGIGVARGNEPDPGQVWAELAPWESFDLARNLMRARVWARRVGKHCVAVPVPVQSERPADDGAALLAAVIEQPEALELREVYRDWLLERGDERGELIAMQLQRSKLPRADEGRRALLAAEEPLTARLRERWQKRLPEGADVLVRNGFVERVSAPVAALVSGQLDELMREEPVTELSLIDLAPSQISTLGAWPHLHRLRALQLMAVRAAPIQADGLARLLETDQLSKLTSLVLFGQQLGDTGAIVLASNLPRAAPRLERFEWANDWLTALGADILFPTRWFNRLRSLKLFSLQLDPSLVALLSAAPGSDRLESLALPHNRVTDDGAGAIAHARRFATLRSLDLQSTHLGPEGVRALLDSPFLTRLERLNVDDNRIGSKLDLALKTRFGQST